MKEFVKIIQPYLTSIQTQVQDTNNFECIKNNSNFNNSTNQIPFSLILLGLRMVLIGELDFV